MLTLFIAMPDTTGKAHGQAGAALLAIPAMTSLNAPLLHLERSHRPTLAWRHLPAADAQAPTVLFLPGYASDMAGTKAAALWDHAAARGIGCALFDYAGCGLSDGDFMAQTLADWLADALAIAGQLPRAAPVIIVGSSMGGWLMLHVALALGPRVAGVVGIAAAPDFTRWDFAAADHAALAAHGHIMRGDADAGTALPYSAALVASGESLCLLDRTIPLRCPVTLLHGQADDVVPPALALTLAERIGSSRVLVTLVKDGDHRLSRAQDIALLTGAIDHIIDTSESAAPCSSPHSSC